MMLKKYVLSFFNAGTTSVSVLSLCNVDVTATSYVRLTSSAYRDMIPQGATLDPSRSYYSSPCTCRMTLPGNTEMQISRTKFWKSEPGYNCDQRVVVETFAGEVVAVFCGTQKIHQFLACDENWRDYVIRFETKDPSVNTSFSVDFSGMWSLRNYTPIKNIYIPVVNGGFNFFLKYQRKSTRRILFRICSSAG